MPVKYMLNYREFKKKEWEIKVMTVPYGPGEKEGEVYIPILMNPITQEMIGLKESVENKSRKFCKEGGWLLGWNRN